MNRTVHRFVALFAALLMIWLAGTGSLIQLLDLRSIFAGDPPGDPTQLSIVEGMYGPGRFPVIQVSDFTAPALPADFDLRQGVHTVLQAAHQDSMDWLELRVAGGAPIGQVLSGSTLVAFDASSGLPAAAVEPQLLPQGGRLPPSLRQKVKTLHRFWNRGDTPGVYFEFLAGMVLLSLLVTGLVMYFQLLGARARLGRRQWFWSTGGKWRGLHRVVSVAAALFILCMALSGTWIGFESSWNALGRSGGPPPNVVIPLHPPEVEAMAATTLAAMSRLHPGAPIKAIRLRTYGRMKQGVVIAGGDETRQWVFNADSGEPASLTEPSYPRSGFPLGVQVHEDVKHFHSGALFGLSTRMMNLLAGVSLLFLAVSGLVVYADLWLRRRKSGRYSLVWK